MVGLLLGCDAAGDHTDRASPADPPETGAHSESDQIEFVHGYAQGYEHARQSGRPMLVFFTARWCDYCHQMAAEAFTDGRVVNLSRRFVCVLVDADREPNVCREFQIRGYPTVQFISPRGVPLNRLSGKTPADLLAMQMQAALQAIASRARLEETTRR